MADNKRIAKNTLILYFRMFVVLGVSLYTSRIVLKALGVVDYGLYNVVGGLVTMLSCLNGAMVSASSRHITFELGRKDYGRLKNIFSVSFTIHIFLALIITIIAETAGLWFFYNKMEIPAERYQASFWVYQLSIITTFMKMTQVPYDATIVAHENMKIYAYVALFEVMTKLVIVYLIAVSPIDRLIFYALLLCLLQVGIMVFYRFFCARHYGESHIHLCKDKGLYRDMFVFAGSDFIGSLSVMAQGQGLNVLLNMFFGPVVNAARGIAFQVQASVTQFSGNFMLAVRPQVIKSYAEGHPEVMWRLVKQSSCFSFYLMWMICLPIMLEADTLLHTWLGKYPAHTTNFLILVLIICLMQTLKTPRSMIFQAMFKVFWSNITTGVINCLAFPLAYLFLKLGCVPETVFWAAIITMVISDMVGVFLVKIFLKVSVFDYLLNVHAKCALVVIVSFAVSYVLFDRFMDPGFIRLVITCVITTLSVATSSLYLGMDKNVRNKLYKTTYDKFFQYARMK